MGFSAFKILPFSHKENSIYYLTIEIFKTGFHGVTERISKWEMKIEAALARTSVLDVWQ